MKIFKLLTYTFLFLAYNYKYRKNIKFKNPVFGTSNKKCSECGDLCYFKEENKCYCAVCWTRREI